MIDSVEPNLFDFTPETRRSFAHAVRKMRVISMERYHDRTPNDAVTQEAAVALEDAAKLADTLQNHVTGMPDAWTSPADMAALARNTISMLGEVSWRKIDTRANELVRGVWLDEIEAWGREVVVEEAA